MDDDYVFEDGKPSTHALHTLRSMKNGIIGNNTAKSQLVKEGSVQQIVEWLNGEDSDQAILLKTRIAAADVISSLAHGTPECILELYRCRALQALVHALGHLQPTDTLEIKEALCRSLTSTASAYASVAGFGLWGLGKNYPRPVRDELRLALDELFRIESLDVILPLLEDSTSCMISVAHLIGLCVDRFDYRNSVTGWRPASERVEAEGARPKRGWEKPGSTTPECRRLGGWVSARLLRSLSGKNVKVLEAALLGIAALTAANSSLADILARVYVDTDALSTLDVALELAISRDDHVRVAACLCATRIIRSRTPTAPNMHRNTTHPMDPSSLTLVAILNKAITDANTPIDARTRMCFILGALVSDSRDLEHVASLSNSPAFLLGTLHSLEPVVKDPDNEPDENEQKSRLREATLTALASLTLHFDPIRRKLLEMQPPFIPLLMASLDHPHVGVRYAGCQCARALSRSVDVVRTSSVDFGLGFKLFDVIKTEVDSRIRNIAVMAMSNLVVDHSPMREDLLAAGVVKYLVAFCDDADDDQLRASAVWAIKNMLYRAEYKYTQEILTELGWERLSKLLMSEHSKTQEQAITMVQNIATDEQEAEFLRQGLGDDVLFNAVVYALNAKEDETVHRGACALLNLSNSLHRSLIASRPELLKSLRERLYHRNVDTRRVVLNSIRRLADGGQHIQRLMKEAGIEAALKERVGLKMGAEPMSAEDDLRLRDDLKRVLSYFLS